MQVPKNIFQSVVGAALKKQEQISPKRRRNADTDVKLGATLGITTNKSFFRQTQKSLGIASKQSGTKRHKTPGATNLVLNKTQIQVASVLSAVNQQLNLMGHAKLKIKKGSTSRVQDQPRLSEQPPAS
jgi:hypothetical protein